MSVFQLNDDQYNAVTYDGGRPLLIQAGPGAGKTRVVVERVKYLVSELGVDAESLLVVTFSVKAANELKERLAEDLAIGVDLVNKMQISTIHSFCSGVIKEYGNFALEVLDDDRGERKNLFMRRHKKDLGFVEGYSIMNYQIESVINKFDEYSTFDVDTEGLLEYIGKNYPVSDEYWDLMDRVKDELEEDEYFTFPYDVVSESKSLRDDWYNARYYGIARAYPKYLELLEEEGYCDFNLLQIKAMELLKKEEVRRDLRFKNILIDEFQDTDPVQMEIFACLLDGCESFTVVGDEDQSIYGFRGSFPKFFSDFANDENNDVITLKTNYRSAPVIVDFNEEFIKDNRLADKELNAFNDRLGNVCYLRNEDKDEQAENIAKVIMYLKESGRIKNYGDVGLLFRSMVGRGYLIINEVVDALERYNIPYDLKNNPDLMENNEVKAILTLFWYMLKDKNPRFSSSSEREWLNLKAFTSDNFGGENVFNLSFETMNILSNLEDNYRRDVIEKEHEVCKEFTGKWSRIRKFDGVFKRSPEILDEIFRRVVRPDISEMSVDELRGIGISDEDDLKFFDKLQDIKSDFYSDELEYYKRPTLLQLYYDLLNFIGIIDDSFDDLEFSVGSISDDDLEESENNCDVLDETDKSDDSMLRDAKKRLSNIALISDTIFNYEDMIYNRDLRGLFSFLISQLKTYGSANIDDGSDKVQIMTIHKSKGLEFPVVIVGNLEKGKFPRPYDKKSKNKKYIAGIANYYTPNEYLNYKSYSEEDEEKIYNMEENRVIYVGLTRAEDILILSCLENKSGNGVPDFVNRLIADYPGFEELDVNDMSSLVYTSGKEVDYEEKCINLSFSSFSDYEFCPHKYDLLYNFGFNISENRDLTYGLLVHSILNKLHTRSKISAVDNDFIRSVIDECLENAVNIDKDDGELNEILERIYDYWHMHGSKWKILGAEVPFSIHKTNYNLNGQIDLITVDGNDITLIDFKTTREGKVYKDLSNYKEQLFVYAIALRNNPEFKDYNISNAMIYTIKDNKPIKFTIYDEDLDDFSKTLDKTSDKIIAELFPRCLKNCGNCEFRYTVCKNARKRHKS